MSDCPRCHRPVQPRAIACPYCKTPLKAYGHPGIPLHRASGDAVLCDRCTYHADDTCTFPQRPHAKECTLFHDLDQPLTGMVAESRGTDWSRTLNSWLRQNAVWLGLIALLVVSFLLVTTTRR